MKLQFFKLLAFIQVAFRAFLVVANKNGSNDLIPPFSYLANQTFTEDVQNVASLDPIRKCIKNGTIALTFDHELNGEYTPKLLDLLKDRKIKATFYIRSVCNYFDPENEENVRLVQRIKAENHTVGISMTDRNTLKNATEFIEALGMSTIAIYEATGVLPRFVHLPKHSIQEDVLRFIDSLGYTRVDANVNLSLNSHDENKGKFSLEHLVNLSCVNNKDGPLNSVIAIQNDDTEFDVDTLNELIHSIQKHCKFYSFVDMQLCIQPNKDTAGSFLIASKTKVEKHKKSPHFRSTVSLLRKSWIPTSIPDIDEGSIAQATNDKKYVVHLPDSIPDSVVGRVYNNSKNYPHLTSLLKLKMNAMTQTKISDNILESTFIPSLTVVKDSPNFPISFEVKETNPSTSRPQSYSKENTDYTSTSFDRQTVTKIRTFTTSSVAVIEIECTHTSSLTFMETVLFPSSSTLKIGTLVDITPSVTPTVSTSQSLVQKGIEATSVSIRELNSTSYTQFVTTLSSETSSIIPTELTHVWRNSSPTNEAISIASYYKNQSSIIHFITEAASATLISTETARITPGSETLNYVNLTPSSTSYINPYPISTNNNTLLTMNENPITFTETLVSTSTFPILDHLTTTETTSLVSASIESGSLSATVPTAVVNTSEISPLSTSSPTPMEKPSLRDLKRRGISALSKPSKSSEKDTTLDPKVIGPNGQLPTRSRKDAKNGRRRLFLKHHGFHMDFPVVRW